MRALFISLLSLLALLVQEGQGFAHPSKITRGEIVVDKQQVRFDLTVWTKDVVAALSATQKINPPDAAGLIRQFSKPMTGYFRRKIKISMSDSTCILQTPKYTAVNQSSMMKVSLLYSCPQGPGPVVVKYRLFYEIDGNHKAMGNAIIAGQKQEFFFDRSVGGLDLGTRGRWQMFAHIFELGIQHILSGYDHLLFLFALIMIRSQFSTIVKTVTAFTVAHSITLAAAWFGLITPPSAIVEIVIAISIAYVALENLFERGSRHRWQTAGVFGLVHGLGFFSVLKDLGLQGAGVVTTLAAFNLGVEVGQLAIVCLLIYPLMWLWKQDYYTVAMKTASVVILLIALWWIWQRLPAL